MIKSDSHTSTLDGDHDAVELVTATFTATPDWLHVVLGLRDRIVGQLGFASQPNPRPHSFDVAPGAKAGPFVFSEVGPEAVVGGNRDAHIDFTTIFGVDGRTASIRTEARANSTVGAAYLTAIWPFHRLLMPVLLARGTRALARG